MIDEFRKVDVDPRVGITFDMTVEIPRGTKNKYEMDHNTGRIRLDRTLFTSTQYPYDYGFIEGTLGEDGDPLDAMVIVAEPTFPGCLIECRAVAMFQMQDEMGGDDKVLCIPTADTRRNYLDDLAELPQFMLLEIEHFFTVYKDLEPGKSVEGATWVGREAAEAEIRASIARAKGPVRAPQGRSGLSRRPICPAPSQPASGAPGSKPRRPIPRSACPRRQAAD